MARQKTSEFVGAGYKMVRVFEALANAILDAGGTDEDVRRVETQEGLAVELAGIVMKNNPVEVPLLEFVRTVAVPSRERFVAADHFREDTSANAVIKIDWLADYFKNNFLSKIERDVPEAELTVRRLKTVSQTIPIIAELGGEKKAETTLAHLFHLLSLQPNGEDGILLTNGYANIFYIRDVHRDLWAVDVVCHNTVWDVSVSSIRDPDEWHAGRQVFSG